MPPPVSNSPPGFLSGSAHPEVVAMIGTAGHVDHGKTTLVKMLTGCETDRLKEEKRRGLTIELGFAPCFLGGELCVGIVDVPGHERFIKNMVAGVAGIDLTVLVIAADDGVMPQTVEHVQIMELMGVRHGIAVLTKTDLVEPERLAQRLAEVRTFLDGTFLRGASIFPVSSVTGEGYGPFYDALVERLGELARRRRTGIFRMPVERVFRREGHGAVVSGIPLSGAVAVGDVVEAVPSGGRGRVRGLQCFLRNAERGGAGQCLALNIPDLGKTPPERGDVLAPPDYLRPATFFLVRLHGVPGAVDPLRNAEEVKWHTGTLEEPAKVFLLEGKELAAGATMLATVAGARPVAAAPGDRFIVRRLSPAWTLAGGVILEAVPGEHRPRRKLALERLRGLEAALAGRPFDSPEAEAARVAHYLRAGAAPAATVEELARALLLPPATVQGYLAAGAAEGRLLALDVERWVHADRLEACAAVLRKRAEETAAGGALSLSTRELRKDLDWPPALLTRVEARLAEEGVLAFRGDRVLLPAATDGLAPEDRELADRLAALLEGTGYLTPRPDELPELLGASRERTDRMLEHLVNAGRAVRVSDAVVLSYPCYRAAQDFVVETARRDGVVRSQAVRDHLGTTRKYAIALLEFLDRRRVTVRIGNDRKLLPNAERGLL